ncbi:hypothetical protein [Desulfallas thermosapovorans]|uniref:Uncharacterized protein n=1 Tax=Desulfallas thermosapovorans DSM 6562 TaxID=1121431 RepID=A0A5S4ZNE8_9FIRM|nr:hypothetical protein [Desulfallas thermosapovorans]TYO92726.1 hypothetical protein LX24_02856 [Desulfallas thermosapovorans DSM 6562]
MEHTTNTKVIFADSMEEAKEKYLALGLKTEDPQAVLECYKVSELDDFDINEDFNFVGEISVSPEVMNTIRQDAERAYVLYYIENI